MAGAVLLLVLSHGARLWAVDMAVTGVVVKSGLSGVMLKASSGAEAVKYQTGKKTVFTPDKYRPSAGDTVTVHFSRQHHKGKEILAASALSLVSKGQKAPYRPAISSPAVGIVWKVGRKRIKFAFLGNGQVFTMEMTRGTQKVPERWRPRAGDKVRIFYEMVPARFVRKTVMVIRKMERV